MKTRFHWTLLTDARVGITAGLDVHDEKYVTILYENGTVEDIDQTLHVKTAIPIEYPKASQ